MGTMAVLRERMQGGAPVSRLLGELLEETGYLEALRAERTIEAQGRIENLEELVNVAAEYDASDSAQPSVAEFLQQIALVADADTRVDDDGLVTLMTLHNAKGLEYPVVFMIGFEDGRLPALARARGGRDRGGAAALLRRHHPRRARSVHHLCALADGVRGARLRRSQAASCRRYPANLTDAEEQRPRGVGRMRERLISWPTAAPERREREVIAYRLGDDVVHPKWGDGVVTGIEPGGIVVIRFSGDRSERKLVADLAPITKR